MTNKTLLLVLMMLFPFMLLAEGKTKTYQVESPNKKIVFSLHIGAQTELSATYEGQTILLNSEIGMELSNQILGKNAQIDQVEENSISESIQAIVKIKEAQIANNCNELVVYFKDHYTISLRAYNEGIAYRFATSIDGDITILSETGKYQFPENHMMWWGAEWRFQSNNQVYYQYKSIREMGEKDLASLPLILNPSNGPKIVLAETDLVDYPGMWLRGTHTNTITTVSPKYPKTIKQTSDRDLEIKDRENYIAKTNGTRTFPWRIFAIAEKDADLITNQLTFILSTPNKLKETSWIKPGKIAWDWWNANNIYGVDFEAGVNTETYKYYIDFAAKYGIENILLDEGWYNLGDLYSIADGMDMKELIDYANSKNVGVIVWVVWKTLDEQLDALAKFEEMGIKGIKIDFMDRDDQAMVQYFHKIAKLAAKHHLMVDFHGSYKPAGIRRTYPNVMTREGVNGGEQFKWSVRQTPEHDLILPFGRMLAGPMDYTPGAMHNAQKKDYKPIFDTPMSTGTRCHQLAMYVCYESPLQMLCDAPSNYYKEPEAMEFLSVVPTVWDETIALDGKISDYLLVARRNGENWFIGGMSDWDSRDIEVDLSFLPDNKKYQMTLYQDGVNADRIAIDFKQTKSTVDHSFKQNIHLAKGGGMVIILSPME